VSWIGQFQKVRRCACVRKKSIFWKGAILIFHNAFDISFSFGLHLPNPKSSLYPRWSCYKDYATCSEYSYNYIQHMSLTWPLQVRVCFV